MHQALLTEYVHYVVPDQTFRGVWPHQRRKRSQATVKDREAAPRRIVAAKVKPSALRSNENRENTPMLKALTNIWWWFYD